VEIDCSAAVSSYAEMKAELRSGVRQSGLLQDSTVTKLSKVGPLVASFPS
jgi:hypothetical protein